MFPLSLACINISFVFSDGTTVGHRPNSNILYCSVKGCNFSTQTKRKLKMHQKFKHTQVQECSYGCSYKSDRRYRIIRHENTVHPTPVAERRQEIIQNLPPLSEDPMWGTTVGWEEQEYLPTMPTSRIYDAQPVLTPVVAPHTVV